MEPGVIRSGNDLKAYGNFKKDQIVAINLSSNSSAVAVGTLERDSMDMYMSGGRGICVRVLHVFGDKLWGLDQSVIKQIPMNQAVYKAPNIKNDDDFPALGTEKPTVSDVKLKETENQVEVTNQQDQQVEEIQLSPDELLKNSFMRTLKNNRKELLSKLPLIVAIFYPTYVLKQAELDNISITIKDTSFKKVSTFMKKMSEENFVVIREESKGVEKIMSINFEHPELSSVAMTPKPKAVVEESHNLILTKMTELYLVNDETKEMFAKLGVHDGDSLDATQIKNYVKDYVSREKLIDSVTKKVTLNSTLKGICNIPDDTDAPQIDLDQLIRNVTQKMTETFEMRSSSAPQIKGGKKPIIQISTATRSGNKKVTMIRNLDMYGINIAEFSKLCKNGVQASTSITKIAGTNLDQFQIQGNHVKFIHDLLVEKFGVAKGNITGLEFAKKDKKKK